MTKGRRAAIAELADQVVVLDPDRQFGATPATATTTAEVPQLTAVEEPCGIEHD
jgi:hypothetical protein